MDHYKQINKQLIDANRELKKYSAMYQKDLCLLRAKLMEEHRLRVEGERDFRDRLVLLLVQNFRTVLRAINPNLGILEAFSLYDVDIGGGSEGAAYSTGNQESGNALEHFRRSTEIVEGFRRSNVLYRRSSVAQKSPARHSQSSSMIGSGRSEEEEPHCSETEVDNAAVINVEYETSSPVGLNLIIEGNENDSEESLISASMRSLEVSQKGGVRGQQSPLRDSSNYHSDNENDTEESVISVSMRSLEVSQKEECAQGARGQQIPLRDLSNHQSDVYMAIPNVVVNRGRPLVQRKLLNNSENSIESARCSANGARENVNRSPSLPFSEMSMGNFKEAACSTPRSLTPLLQDITSTSSAPSQTSQDDTVSKNSFTNTKIETSKSSRPSRKCAPKLLVEPKLGTKLRNNATTNKTRKNK